jgi:hypothetical protein
LALLRMTQKTAAREHERPRSYPEAERWLAIAKGAFRRGSILLLDLPLDARYYSGRAM